MTRDLNELVERARKIEMTPEQEAEQRRSFAYGNTHIENDRITRELIADIDRNLGLTADQTVKDVLKLIKLPE